MRRSRQFPAPDSVHRFALGRRQWHIQTPTRLTIGRALSVTEHQNVLAIPAKLRGGETYDGGLLRSDHRPLARAALVRGMRRRILGGWPNGLPEPSVRDDAYTLRGYSFYGGFLFHHFGHFLLEGLARLWAMSQVPRIDRVIFHHWPPEPPPTFVEQCLGAVLPEGTPVEYLTAPVLLESTIVPDPAFRLASWVSASEALAPFRTIASKILPYQEPVSCLQTRIYLSRGGLGAGARQIAGEDELEDALASRGWEVVRPETLPLAKQIALFNRAQVVMGLAGSALHTVLFASAPVQLVCLTTPIPHANHLLCDTVIGGRTFFLPVLRRCAERGTPSSVPMLSLDWRRTLVTLDALESSFERPIVPARLS